MTLNILILAHAHQQLGAGLPVLADNQGIRAPPDPAQLHGAVSGKHTAYAPAHTGCRTCLAIRFLCAPLAN